MKVLDVIYVLKLAGKYMNESSFEINKIK